MTKKVEIKYEDNTRTFTVKKFDLNKMIDNPAICMISGCCTGKSWIVRDIVNHFQTKTKRGIVISPTNKFNSFYSDFIPERYIYSKYDTKIIKKLIKHQYILLEKAEERKKEGKKINVNSFIVLDDCLSAVDNKWVKDKELHSLFCGGRCYRIGYLLSMQYSMGIRPEVRTNFDYIFLFRDNLYMNQKRMYEHYGGIFPDFETFRQVYFEFTENYGAMVIVNRGFSCNFEDKIFYYNFCGKNKEQIGNALDDCFLDIQKIPPENKYIDKNEWDVIEDNEKDSENSNISNKNKNTNKVIKISEAVNLGIAIPGTK